MQNTEYGRPRIGKKGIRALGVAESFHKKLGSRAVLAAVAMRSDLVVDGMVLGTCTVGGMDATDSIITLWKAMGRDDIQLVMLNGCVISWFNVIDLTKLHQELKRPIICLTYEESAGIENYFRRYFPEDWEERLRIHLRNGERCRITLKTGFDVFIRSLGIDADYSKKVLDKFTLHGKYPEPIRLAKMAAHSVLEMLSLGA